MKKNLVSKINEFFKTVGELTINLEDYDSTFTLDEGGMFDSKVIFITPDGIILDDDTEIAYDDMAENDLEYLVEYVIDAIKTSDEKTFKRILN